MEKYMKLYLRHIDFKQPVESPTRIVLSLIKNISQKLPVKMENDNIVILAEVKDMGYNKWEESTENTEERAYIFTSGAYKCLWNSKGTQREKKGKKSDSKGRPYVL